MFKSLALSAIAMLTLVSCQGNSSSKADANQTNDTKDMTATNPDDVKVAVKTTLGDFTVLLYGDTPKHRDNFVKLVNDGFYNGTLFHRVINEFMVQAGDPDSKTAKPGQHLGAGDMGYTIEAEIDCPNHFHKRGALAAARTGDQVNPERRSSGSQFYVVTGRKYAENEIGQLEKQMENMGKENLWREICTEHMAEIQKLQAAKDDAGLEKLQNDLIAELEKRAAANPVKMSDAQREAYTTVGGTPFLDGQYTVFGEVLSGMETIDKIEKAQTDSSDRPKDDIKIISMKIIK